MGQMGHFFGWVIWVYALSPMTHLHIYRKHIVDCAKRLMVIPASSAECKRHFSAFNARHIIASQRNLLFPETVEALSIVLEGYKKIAAVNCHGRTSFSTHLSSVYVSHSVTEIEQCCIFIRVFCYLLCIKHFYCFYKVRGCVVNLVGHGSCIMGHGSVFVWVSGSWVTACDPLFTLVGVSGSPAGRGRTGAGSTNWTFACLHLENGERYDVRLNGTQRKSTVGYPFDGVRTRPTHERGQEPLLNFLYALRGHLSNCGALVNPKW